MSYYIAFSHPENLEQLQRTVHMWGIHGSVEWVIDQARLRSKIKDMQEHLPVVLIGSGDVNHETWVSDINLAAAIVKDGYAKDVYFILDKITGSVSSRARAAKISGVLEYTATDVSKLFSDDVSLADNLPDFSSSLSSTSECSSKHLLWPEFTGKGRAPILIVSSARGGVGKTAFAACLAELASSWHMQVDVVDLDFTAGNVASCFGAMSEIGLDQALKRRAQSMDECLSLAATPHEHLRIWGSVSTPEMGEVVSSYIREFLTRIRKTSDLIILDTSSAINDAIAEALMICDRYILLSRESGDMAYGLSRLCNLAVGLGLARTKICYVERHASNKRFSFKENRDGAETLQITNHYSLVDGGKELQSLLSEGHIDEVVEFKTAYARSVEKILNKILQELGRLPAHIDVDKTNTLPQAERRGFFRTLKEGSLSI